MLNGDKVEELLSLFLHHNPFSSLWNQWDLIKFHAVFVDLFLGVVNVSVTAEAVTSQASCDNEIVSVPDRGRIDVVTRSLIVKVGTLKTRWQRSISINHHFFHLKHNGNSGTHIISFALRLRELRWQRPTTGCSVQKVSMVHTCQTFSKKESQML